MAQNLIVSSLHSRFQRNFLIVLLRASREKWTQRMTTSKSLPWNADRMVNAVSREDVEKLRNRSAGPHDAEQGQKQVPAGQDPPHFEPRPRGHDLLAGEHQDEIDAGRVEADGAPVGHHPCLGFGVLEVSLEVEDVRVVRAHQKVAGHRQRVHSCHLRKNVNPVESLNCGEAEQNRFPSPFQIFRHFEQKIKRDR